MNSEVIQHTRDLFEFNLNPGEKIESCLDYSRGVCFLTQRSDNFKRIVDINCILGEVRQTPYLDSSVPQEIFSKLFLHMRNNFVGIPELNYPELTVQKTLPGCIQQRVEIF